MVQRNKWSSGNGYDKQIKDQCVHASMKFVVKNIQQDGGCKIKPIKIGAESIDDEVSNQDNAQILYGS